MHKCVHLGLLLDSCLFQVLMVAGGLDCNQDRLSSTEQLLGESGSWKTTSSLPRAVGGVVGITLDNILYLTGG